MELARLKVKRAYENAYRARHLTRRRRQVAAAQARYYRGRREEIFRRDGYACHYCGSSGKAETQTIDHKVPRTLGGTNDPANLLTACRSCNLKKGERSYAAYRRRLRADAAADEVLQGEMAWWEAQKEAQASMTAASA